MEKNLPNKNCLALGMFRLQALAPSTSPQSVPNITSCRVPTPLIGVKEPRETPIFKAIFFGVTNSIYNDRLVGAHLAPFITKNSKHFSGPFPAPWWSYWANLAWFWGGTLGGCLEVQPPIFIRWFPNRHYFSKGLSSGTTIFKMARGIIAVSK